jgi:enoyl-CoA hydratase/carnithine racemase
MEDTTPVLSRVGQVAEIRLNRPRYKNRLQREDLGALSKLLKGLSADRTIRVVVITGSGDIFSAGFDLNALAAGETGDPYGGPGGCGRVADAIERLPQPVIARLNGSIYGGATDLALACDFRVGVTSLQAAMPAAGLGLHYYRSGIGRYLSRLGLDAAKRMFLTGATLGAEELLRIGFLTSLVDAAALDAHVNQLAAMLAANAPLAVQGMKLALNELARGEHNDTAFAERANAALQSQDLRRGIAAHRSRRPPQFEGN